MWSTEGSILCPFTLDFFLFRLDLLLKRLPLLIINFSKNFINVTLPDPDYKKGGDEFRIHEYECGSYPIFFNSCICMVRHHIYLQRWDDNLINHEFLSVK